jgi:hypothetical protein
MNRLGLERLFVDLDCGHKGVLDVGMDPFTFQGKNIVISNSHELPLPTILPGATVHYEFVTEGGDILFGVVFARNQNSSGDGIFDPQVGNASEEKMLQPVLNYPRKGSGLLKMSGAGRLIGTSGPVNTVNSSATTDLSESENSSDSEYRSKSERREFRDGHYLEDIDLDGILDIELVPSSTEVVSGQFEAPMEEGTLYFIWDNNSAWFGSRTLEYWISTEHSGFKLADDRRCRRSSAMWRHACETGRKFRDISDPQARLNLAEAIANVDVLEERIARAQERFDLANSQYVVATQSSIQLATLMNFDVDMLDGLLIRALDRLLLRLIFEFLEDQWYGPGGLGAVCRLWRSIIDGSGGIYPVSEDWMFISHVSGGNSCSTDGGMVHSNSNSTTRNSRYINSISSNSASTDVALVSPSDFMSPQIRGASHKIVAKSGVLGHERRPRKLKAKSRQHEKNDVPLLERPSPARAENTVEVISNGRVRGARNTSTTSLVAAPLVRHSLLNDEVGLPSSSLKKYQQQYEDAKKNELSSHLDSVTRTTYETREKLEDLVIHIPVPERTTRGVVNARNPRLQNGKPRHRIKTEHLDKRVPTPSNAPVSTNFVNTRNPRLLIGKSRHRIKTEHLDKRVPTPSNALLPTNRVVPKRARAWGPLGNKTSGGQCS